jgi:DNA polymerase-3 subunit epsilon
MIEVILDTETTGLSVEEGHRIVEIGCIELDNQIPTNKTFHAYINPQRKVSQKALDVHGYTDEFLENKKKFSEIVDNFLDFIKDKKLIMHNAQFDLSFLNQELRLVQKKTINKSNVIDTLEIARQKYPGSQNSLDALCKRFNIDNSRRVKHSAIVDCQLLKTVYINLLDQKEPKFNFDINNLDNKKTDEVFLKNNVYSKKIIKPSIKEIEQHKIFLKENLKKNFYL